MSSPRSPQPADGLAALGDAVRQVAEASLFACAEPCDASRTAGHVVLSGADFDLIVNATTDFWRWRLYGDAGAGRRLERRDNLDSEF